MTDLQERWAVLASQVTARMQLRALTPAQLAEKAGYSVETIRPIHTGKVARLRPATKAAVARALGWRGDSIDLILDGQDPVVVDTTDDERLRETLAEVVHRLDWLEARVRDLEAGGMDDDGDDNGEVRDERVVVEMDRLLRAARSGDDPGPGGGGSTTRGEGAEDDDPNPAGL